MKRVIPVLVVVAALVAIGVMYYPASSSTKVAEISVPDMMCENCVEHVKAALVKVEGVQETAVSLETKTARVVYNAKMTDEEALLQAIHQAGYGKSAEAKAECDGEKRERWFLQRQRGELLQEQRADQNLIRCGLCDGLKRDPRLAFFVWGASRNFPYEQMPWHPLSQQDTIIGGPETAMLSPGNPFLEMAGCSRFPRLELETTYRIAGYRYGFLE
ncbi:MAG: heavy metal-associated domain-containing protein [candidate division KSB1 bacterium]|nr:heavy metal-associated domain-containing protein [candidate division KSB1 bacterium]